ncbi:Erg28-like protein [Pleurotus eryngii]|uniref:Erg28-like protein n=1 Tax=Pleurotus eryngii TaxID=5323 RepID=A0A9P6A0F9_PLEER|nr:Erg28-like protein [Pleurotus eryngii]
MLSFLTEYLPQSPGLLPKWQLFVAATAVFNAVQNFATLTLTRRVYNRVPPTNVTALQARTFAVWTLTSAVVRGMYEMAFLTYVIALAHFGSEYFIYKTAKIPGGVLGPFIVASTSLIWMYKQYDFYVKA